jgi:hypothetical protein
MVKSVHEKVLASPVLTPAYSQDSDQESLGYEREMPIETLPRSRQVPKAKEFHCQFDK